MSRADAQRRTGADYVRAAEAAFYLMTARIAIRCVPFRQLARVFTRRVPREQSTSAAQARAIASVRRAVTASASRLPGQTVCFPRAIAAQAMLRRRGVSSTLYYGAKTALDRRLRAHVWLRAGSEGVVGQEIASQYAVLASYSSANIGTTSRKGIQ